MSICVNTEEDKKRLNELLEEIKPIAKKKGIDLRIIEIKETIYFFPEIKE